MAAVPNQGKEQKQETLREVVEALHQGLGNNLVAVVLFGSQARGEATEVSDWDLLVLAHGLPSIPLQRHVQLTTLLPVKWQGNPMTEKEQVSYRLKLAHGFLRR
jgi:predicted nucleotidyltransferase